MNDNFHFFTRSDICSITQPSVALCAALGAFSGAPPASELPSNFDPRNVIFRDVAIIGGGSSGIYAAIQLKYAGKSVIVVEFKPIVGGHTNTYTDRATGISKFIAFLTKYPQLASGMFLPRPVPQELSIPFGRLTKQLGIEAVVPFLIKWNTATGDASTIPATEFIRVAGLELVQQVISPSFVTSTCRNNSEIYGKAQTELLQAQSLLLSSEVIDSLRKENKVELVVKTLQGIKYICVKKLIFTVPPRLENLAPFNPTQNERSVFVQWLNTSYYTCTKPGIVLAAPNAIPGHSNVYYSTPRGITQYPLSVDAVKARIVTELKRAQVTNRNNSNFTQAQPEFVICHCHVPFSLQVTSEDIALGFYDRMNALQGQKSKCWTGATWRAHESNVIWNFNKQILLPMVMKGLQICNTPY
ncbi:hypothetical protein yc1106_03054 [Curvularia clavata]|uniref:Uncharacterized protein n=1 Tax=Curvularia clavata TaxID=95742 RepID=A0A9Q8Z503_CURCL|nr:hypothetical protein yc1106_03054 [Curvularia clavata]